MEDHSFALKNELLQSQIKQLENTIKNLETSRETQQQILNRLNTPELRNEYPNTYQQAINEVNRLTIEIDLNQKALFSTQSELIENSERQEDVDQEVRVPDFYDFLSGITKIPPAWLQFILSIIPACFIDLVAPMSLSFGLTLIAKKEKRKKDVLL